MSGYRMFATVGTALLLLTGLVQAASSGFDVFVSFQGIPGDSLEANHLKWTRAKYFRYEASGQGEGSLALGNTIEVMKETDSATPALFQQMMMGSHLGCVVIECCPLGAGSSPFLRVELSDVSVTRIDMVGYAQKEGVPTSSENVCLTFRQIVMTVIQYDASGQIGSTKQMSWVFAK